MVKNFSSGQARQHAMIIDNFHASYQFGSSLFNSQLCCGAAMAASGSQQAKRALVKVLLTLAAFYSLRVDVARESSDDVVRSAFKRVARVQGSRLGVTFGGSQV